MTKGHRPARFALSPNERPTIALCSGSLDFPIPVAFLKSAAAAAADAEVNFLYLTCHPIDSQSGYQIQANILYTMIADAKIDGILIASNLVGVYKPLADIRAFFQRYHPIPMVSMGMAFEGIPSVLLDNFAGMYAAVVHLIKAHGYRTIAYLGGPEEHPEAQERYRAYATALHDCGLEVDPTLVMTGTFLPPSGINAARKFFDTQHRAIEAVVAANDHMALELMLEIQRRGINVPEDVAIVGFDDISITHAVTPALTTVRQPFDEIGHQAMKLLLARLDKQTVPDVTRIPTRVEVRQSCGCLAAKTHREDTSRAVSGRQNATLQESPRQFFDQLNHAIYQTTYTTVGNIAIWDDALSILRDEQPGIQAGVQEIPNSGASRQIQNTLANTMLLSLQEKHTTDALNRLGEWIISTLNMSELMNALTEGLPQLGVRSGYVVLYEDAPPYQFPQPVPAWSRLILAHNHQGAVPLPQRGERFPTHELLPRRFWPSENARGMVVEALYFQHEQIGFALFEVGAWDNAVYETLRRYLSSSLHGMLLVQRAQKHAAEIARQKYILDTFMENVPDRVYFKDLENHITRANRAHATSLGLNDPTEVLGKSDFDFLPEEQAHVKYEQEQEIIRTGQPLLNLEESDVMGHWALTTKMPLRDEKGEIIGTFGISRDITALKQAQAELMRQERLSALGQLTATVAHEIRNPLGTVRTAVFSIGDAIERDEMNRVKRAIQLAERNIVRCDTIISELLDFTRGWAPQLSPTDINAWLNDVLDEMLAQGTIPERITCIRELHANVEVPVDTEHLRRAVINVVSNAVDAMQEKARGENENQLMISTHVVDERLEIHICDTGCGISNEVMKRVLEPLFSTKNFGIGLGLPIVKGIMEQHGGGIEISSQVSIGTTVILWLPMIMIRNVGE